MPRLFNRPRNMPRLFQGRMFNRLTGQRAPRLYSGNRRQRASHRRFQTQVGPYGADMGGQGQAMTVHAGGSGVWGAMASQIRRGGTNLGMRTVTPGYRGTRMHRGFRQDQASIKRDFKNQIREQRRLMRAPGADKNAIRSQLAQLRGQHRTERRAHAQGRQTEWAAKHNFNLGGGKRRQFDYQRKGDRRTMLSPRMGINVGQTGGYRYIQGFNFRRQQGGGGAGFNRAQSRNMRIANRMSGGDKDQDMRLHGGQRRTGPQYGLPATHADFTRGGNRRGVIRGYQGHWNRGPNAGTVRRTPRYPASSNIRGTRSTRRPMSSYEKWRAQGRAAPHARDYMNPNAVSTTTPFGWYMPGQPNIFGAGM